MTRFLARPIGVALLSIAVLLVAVACSSSASAAARPVETNHVELPPSYLFSPAAIQVPTGATVTWHNGDNFTHSVLVSGVGDQALVARPGDTVSLRFDKPGTYNYKCTFHPNMTGQVIVAASQQPSS